VTTIAGRRQAAFPHGETTVNDQGGSTGDGHGRSPFGRYFLFGRWVSAEAAAVFAALLLLGLRNTLAAALAARLLVTSPFEPRFGMSYLPIRAPITIDGRHQWE
jgi:hypothetical protein